LEGPSERVTGILEKARTLAVNQGARLFCERASATLKADVHKESTNNCLGVLKMRLLNVV
jgi:hypothetical protein